MPNKHKRYQNRSLKDDSEKLDPISVIEIGERQYQSLKKALESAHQGSFVFINVRTGEFVVADTRGEVMDKHQELFPGAQGFLRRIGELDDGGQIRI